MKPTVGRIVHYIPTNEDIDAIVENGGSITNDFRLAAIVVDVYKSTNTVTLLIHAPGHSFQKEMVMQGVNGGEWNWPERV